MLDEKAKRILFMDTKAQVVVGFKGFCGTSDRVFDIPFNDLAKNEELLTTLNLVSMYADGTFRGEQYAIDFFVTYLSSFYSDEGVREQLETNPMIRILIQDKEKLEKVTQIFANPNLV